MKIGEYEQMMSYLTRPDTRTKLAGGTNPETGQGFQKGNTGFRTKDGEVRNVKGKNQYGPIRTLEEVQKAINDAPAITIKGKTFERNAKDLMADSSYVNKKEGGTQYITRKEFDEYKDELKFKASGPKNFSEETIKKARDKRRDFTKKRSSESLEKALAAPQKSKLNFHHAGFKESLTDLKNTMYIPGSPNRKMAKLFEDPLLKEMEAFTKIFDNPKATTKQKQKAATDYLKNDRSLRQKYPQFKNFKTRLSFRRTAFEPGIMFKEKLPDPSLAISNEPGMTLKGETSKSPRGKEIIKKAAEKRGTPQKLETLTQKSLMDQIKNLNIKIPTSDLLELGSKLPGPFKLLKLKKGFEDGGIVSRQNLGRGYLAGGIRSLGKKYKDSTLEAILENPKLMGTEIGYEGIAEILRLLGLYSVGGHVKKND
jgi:hypothetical protein